MTYHNDNNQDIIEISIWLTGLPSAVTIVDLPLKASVSFVPASPTRRSNSSSSLEDSNDSPTSLAEQPPTNLVREVLFDPQATVQDLIHILLPTATLVTNPSDQQQVPVVSQRVNAVASPHLVTTISQESMMLTLEVPARATSKAKTVALSPTRRISSYFSLVNATTVWHRWHSHSLIHPFTHSLVRSLSIDS